MNQQQIKIEKTHPERLFKMKGALYHLMELLEFFRKNECESMVDTIDTLVDVYSKKLSTMTTQPSTLDLRLIAKGLLADSVFVEAAMTIGAVLNNNNKPNYYIIQNDFFKKFLKVKLDKLRFTHLPNASGYIKLPFPVTDAEGTEYYHVYFFCGKDTDYVKAKDWRTEVNPANPAGAEFKFVDGKRVVELGSRLLQIAFIEHPQKDDFDLSERAVRSFGFRLPKNEDQLLTSFFSEITDTHTMTLDGLLYEQKKTSYSDYLRVIVNLIMYIHSGEPDIREFRNSLKLPGQRKRKVISSETLSVLNLKLVGFNWKKSIIKNYSLKSWDVDGHFRWQRYGKQWSQVKLIWIDPHSASRSEDMVGGD